MEPRLHRGGQSLCSASSESAEFIPAMLDIRKAEQIGLLVPTIDTELLT